MRRGPRPPLVLVPIDALSKEQSRNELHHADGDRSKPADHERHHLPSVSIFPREVASPAKAYQALRSVVPARLRSSYTKTGVPSPLVSPLSLKASELPQHQLTR